VPPAGVNAQPLVDGRAVYASGAAVTGSVGSLTVTATARGTGAPLWRQDIFTGPGIFQLGRVVSVANDKVLLYRSTVDNGSTLHFEELDARTGASLRLSRALDEIPVKETIVVSGNDIAYQAGILVGTMRFAVVVRSRETLEVLWQADLTAPITSTLGPLLVSDGLLYTPDVTGSTWVLRAYAVDGCGASMCSPISTIPLPPAPGGASARFRLAAAMTDGPLLVVRTWNDASGRHEDLLGIDPDGTVAFTVPLTSVVGVAVAGTDIFVVGADAATPAGGRSLLAFAGADPLWRADTAEAGGALALAGAPVVAGGVVFVGDNQPNGVDVRAYDATASGCATGSSCAALAVLDGGPGAGTTFGLSATFGTLYVTQPAPGNRLIAYGLPPSG
jgi:outer membrane protein assembly factor BamB